MKQLVEQLQQWEFRVCGVFLVDSQFMVESFKVGACSLLYKFILVKSKKSELGLFSPEESVLRWGRPDCCFPLPQTQAAAKKMPVVCKEKKSCAVRVVRLEREIV